MRNCLLLSLLLAISAKDTTARRCDYSLSYRSLSTPEFLGIHTQILVNGKIRYCHCGKDAVAAMMVYGYLECFCFEHLSQMIDVGYNV